MICRKATITVNASADMINFSRLRFPMAILVFTVPIPAFPVPSHILPSTKSRFLCAFCLRDPHFRAFQAQKSTFCTILPSRTPDFRLFEHKIEVFVRFWGLEPLFSGISSTKIDFLYYFALRNPRFRAFRAQNWHFCAREAGKAA